MLPPKSDRSHEETGGFILFVILLYVTYAFWLWYDNPIIITICIVMFHGEMHDNIIMRKDKKNLCCGKVILAWGAFRPSRPSEGLRPSSGQKIPKTGLRPKWHCRSTIFFCPSSWWYCRAFLHESLHDETTWWYYKYCRIVSHSPLFDMQKSLTQI